MPDRMFGISIESVTKHTLTVMVVGAKPDGQQPVRRAHHFRSWDPRTKELVLQSDVDQRPYLRLIADMFGRDPSRNRLPACRLIVLDGATNKQLESRVVCKGDLFEVKIVDLN